jgi:hypothetical protein
VIQAVNRTVKKRFSKPGMQSLTCNNLNSSRRYGRLARLTTLDRERQHNGTYQHASNAGPRSRVRLWRPAFNVNNLEQMRAIMEAADKTDSPVIVQASAGARKYAGAPFLRHLILAAIEEFPHIPVCMHQDHGTSPDVCQRSIQLGFSSVMMDGSLGEDGKTPTDYEYNVRVTQQTVALAHACGVSVEGELGCLGSLETGMAGEEDGIGAEGVLDHSQMLTDPEEAADFVKKTQVTPWPSPSAPATAPTSSPSRLPETCLQSTASRKSTSASPTPTG